MRRQRPSRLAVAQVAGLAGLLVMAACGPGDTADDAASESAPSAASATTGATKPTKPVETVTAEPSADLVNTTLPGQDSNESPATTVSSSATTVAVADESWPDETCSADGSATETAANDGELPDTDVRAASADSKLPDLSVRRLNCSPEFVNLKNELPSEKPVLVWFWAPH